jgi:hypothetical protein
VIAAGAENVSAPVDVNDVITGALTVILNCLVTAPKLVVAVIVNVVVVSVPTALTLDQVILPVDVLSVKPVGSEPVETEYVIVSPSASVAPTKSAAVIVP